MPQVRANTAHYFYGMECFRRIHPVHLFALFCVALAVKGCTAYVDTGAFGPALTSTEEIEQYFSGNTLRNVVGGATYFAEDGTMHSVETRIDQVASGAWSVKSGRTPKLCMGRQTGAYAFANEVRDFSIEGYCYAIRPQPDGTTRMDATGNPDYITGRLVAGFPLASRYNDLRRKLALE